MPHGPHPGSCYPHPHASRCDRCGEREVVIWHVPTTEGKTIAVMNTSVLVLGGLAPAIQGRAWCDDCLRMGRRDA